MRVFLTHTEEELARYYGERPLRFLSARTEVVHNTTGRVLSGRALAEAAAGCEVIVAHRTAPGEAETFANAPDLVAFLRAAVDLSTVDVAAASAHAILVTHASPGFTDAVAELALGLMIDLSRDVTRNGAAWRAGRAPAPRMGIQLRGATLGLIGFGRIARRLSVLVQGIGMRVLANDPAADRAGPGVRFAPMDQLLAESDFVVLLAASTPETRGLMDAAAFAAMRPGAAFLNLSRGELVDEAALEAALESGRLRGAALDVGSGPDQTPPERLVRRPDVVATPHIGGLTTQAADRQAMDTVSQVMALLEGRVPDGAVNLEHAHRLERLRGG